MKNVLILFLVIPALIVGCEPINRDEINQDGQKESENKEKIGFAGITEKQCKEAKGYWNECGSPCAGTNAEVCIQMCQVQCECGGIAGFMCPEGFKCRLTGKIADEMGVCVEG